MSPADASLETGRRLANALDAEDYGAAQACLAADCVYHRLSGVLTGREAIVASYRENAAAGRQRFDAVQYESFVESLGAGEVLITYTDRVRLGHRSHDFRCQQRIWIRVGGLVAEIRHEELPGERERLAAFLEVGGP
jgi:hypothetical protein